VPQVCLENFPPLHVLQSTNPQLSIATSALEPQGFVAVVRSCKAKVRERLAVNKQEVQSQEGEGGRG
jgi:hypothetical protein